MGGNKIFVQRVASVQINAWSTPSIILENQSILKIFSKQMHSKATSTKWWRGND